MATETQQPSLDDDPFDDEDLLDFEPRERREVVAAKMRQRRRVSPTLAWARILMYVQLVSPMLVIFGTALIGGGGDGETAEVPATTTTTVAQQAQGGRGGGGLIFLIFLAWVAVVIVVASRLARGSAGARFLALGTEALILLASVSVIAQGGGGRWISIVLGTFAVAIIVLLLSPSARKGVDTNVGDTSARFDIRNLPTMEP